MKEETSSLSEEIKPPKTLRLNEDETLVGLKSGDQEVLDKVYKTNYATIEAMILKNSGSVDEAKDIFQDTMIVFYKNIAKEGFELSAAISTYLYSIGRRLWMKRLRETSKLTFSEEDSAIEAFDFELISKSGDETLHQVVELLKKNGKNCLEILKKIYFNNLSFDTIASDLGYASGQVVREQKYRCIKRVRQDIKELQLTLSE